MPNVHKQHVKIGHYDELVHTCRRRNVQRHELTLRERESSGAALMEKPIPCSSDRSQHGPPRRNSIHPLLHCKHVSFSLKLALINVLQNLFAINPLNWTEWKAVLLISAPVILIDEVLKFFTVSLFQ